ADLKFQFTLAQVERAIPDDDKPLYAELKKKIEKLEKGMRDRPQTWGFHSVATAPLEVLPMKGFYPLPYQPERLAQARPYLLEGGDVQRRGKALDPGWPALFGPTPADAIRSQTRPAPPPSPPQ